MWTYSRALMQGFVNSHSLPALAVESWVGTSLVGKQFAQSNGNPTRQAYLCSDKTTDFSHPSRSGMTCKPLTEPLGEAVLTWFLEGFLAKTSAAPAKVLASPVLAQDYGVRWRELFTKYDHDSHLWKTRPSLWDEGLTWSLQTLPRWGSMRDGALWERVTLARLTSETEFGSSLPTPVKYDTGGRGEGDNYRGLGWQATFNWSRHGETAAVVPHPTVDEKMAKRAAKKALKDEPDADPVIVEHGEGTATSAPVRRKLDWPTPLAGNAKMNGPGFNIDELRNGLPAAVRRQHPTTLGTPTATSAVRSMRSGEGRLPTPQEVVRKFPTPVSNDARGKQSKRPPERVRITSTGLPEADRESGSGAQLSLAQAAHVANRKTLPTPQATNGLRGGHAVEGQDEHYPNMWQSPGHPEYGELSPDWVGWLMGWPASWSNLDPMTREEFEAWEHANGETTQNGDQWGNDPSDDKTSGITKTVKKGDKRDEARRINRIAALGNGQVSAVAAAAFIHLWNLEDPT